MSVEIGGISFDPRLILKGVFESPQIATKVERTLTGVNVPTVRATPGRYLELTTEGSNNLKFGLFTRTQLQSLATLRDTGAFTTLSHHGQVYNIFLPADCIQVTAVSEITPPSPNDKFIGSVRVIEV